LLHQIGTEKVALNFTLPLGRQYSITVDDRKPNLPPSPESHADAFVLGQDTFGNLPIEDVSALSFFVKPGRSPQIACLVRVGMSAELIVLLS
jgi:hypothetical protein